MRIPPHNRAIYRNFGPGGSPLLLSCGFLDKSGQTMDVQNEVYDRVAMIYLIEGSGIYEDDLFGRVPLTAGSLFFRLPDRRHTTQVDPESHWREVFVALRPSWLNLFWETGVLQPRGRAVFGPEYLEELPEEVMRLTERLEKASTAAELSAVEFAVADLMRATRLGQLAGKNDLDESRSRDPLERARKRIEAKLGKVCTIESLFDGLGMSYPRLRALFVERYGVSPGEYRIRLRIDRACSLLKTTRWSLAEIAEKLGYSDAFAFSRQFRERMGMSPSEFRRSG